MEAQQTTQDLFDLISLTGASIIIFILAFVLTFGKKRDTSDQEH